MAYIFWAFVAVLVILKLVGVLVFSWWWVAGLFIVPFAIGGLFLLPFIIEAFRK